MTIIYVIYLFIYYKMTIYVKHINIMIKRYFLKPYGNLEEHCIVGRVNTLFGHQTPHRTMNMTRTVLLGS